MADDLKRRRAGGRSGHAERAGHRAIDQMPWRIPHEPRPAHRADGARGGRRRSTRAPCASCADIGIALPERRGAGDLRQRRLQDRRPRRCAWTKISSWRCWPAPRRQFTITPRNPDRGAARSAARRMLFGNVSSPPNYWDLERGKRPGFMDGFRNVHQADAVLQLHPLRRRLPGRAGRHPRLGPPPRLPLRKADADRQGRPRLFAGQGARRGRDGDGPHRRRA